MNELVGRRKKRPEGIPIRFRSNFRNTIYDVMKGRGWIELADDDDSWDFQWSERDWVYADIDTMHFEPWQRVNHFRNGRELCRKDLLSKNIKRVKRQFEKDGNVEMATKYDFTPVTFILPGDYALFAEEFKKPIHASAPWIMKPIGKSQGQGIFLFTKLSQVSQWKSDYRWKPDNPGVEAYVVQKYITNPYTIGGKKFDMRLYALVTCFNPLTVYVYRSGFCRFSASRYSNEKADVLNNFVHLTNVAVQKTSDAYNAETGGKWEVKKLKTYLTSKHGLEAADKCFTGMQDIMLLSIQAVAKTMMADRHCFELYGYDVLIDNELKPWLIEVNASPSLTANTRDDYDLKYKLLNDVLDIVDMEGRLPRGDVEENSSSSTATTPTTAATSNNNNNNTTSSADSSAAPLLRQVGGFDLVWRDGPIPVGGGNGTAPASGGTAAGGNTNTSSSSSPSPGSAAAAGATTSPPLSLYGTLLGADFDKRLNVFPVKQQQLQQQANTIVVSSSAAAASSSLQSPASSGALASGSSSSNSSSSSHQQSLYTQHNNSAAVASATHGSTSNAPAPPLPGAGAGSSGVNDGSTISKATHHHHSSTLRNKIAANTNNSSATTNSAITDTTTPIGGTSTAGITLSHAAKILVDERHKSATAATAASHSSTNSSNSNGTVTASAPLERMHLSSRQGVRVSGAPSIVRTLSASNSGVMVASAIGAPISGGTSTTATTTTMGLMGTPAALPSRKPNTNINITGSTTTTTTTSTRATTSSLSNRPGSGKATGSSLRPNSGSSLVTPKQMSSK